METDNGKEFVEKCVLKDKSIKRYSRDTLKGAV